ncbi:MAG: hypothetical protein R3Y43_02580 [Alphaproteobacteria bacterium]
MIKEPLFQNNITSQMYSNLHNYFSEGNWFYSICLIFLSLITLASLLKKYQKENCWRLNFNYKEENISIISKLTFGFALITYASILFSLEASLFNNYDLMSPFTTKIFEKGAFPYFGNDGRLNPLGNFDTSIIYAITHNYNIINFYIFAQTLFIIYLLYKFLDFLNINKRFFTLALIIICPSFLWTNNIVFPERWSTAFVILSFIYYKKLKLIPFVVFMNLAIYSKETSVLLYSGILIYSLLENVYKENIKINSFIHPIKTMKKMPFETMIFISCLIFSLLLLCFTIEDDYLNNKKGDFSALLSLYKIDIAINVVSLIYFIINLKNKKNNFLNSLLFSSTFFNIFIICIFQTISAYAYKPYYLQISSIINIIYIISLSKSYKPIVFAFLALFSYQNIYIYQKEYGKQYRELYNFFTQEAKEKKEINIYLSDNNNTTTWPNIAISSAYKYYSPNKKITFKYNNKSYITYLMNKDFLHNTINQDQPIINDYVVIKKNNNYQKTKKELDSIKYNKVYENNLFEVNYVKNK